MSSEEGLLHTVKGLERPLEAESRSKVLRMSRIPCGIFRKSSKWREEVTKTDETKKGCLWPDHSGPLHLSYSF